MVSTDLTQILGRGTNSEAFEGMCANCHSQANVNNNGIDWVFTKN